LDSLSNRCPPKDTAGGKDIQSGESKNLAAGAEEGKTSGSASEGQDQPRIDTGMGTSKNINGQGRTAAEDYKATQPASRQPQSKTVTVCAINERDLNKVELAFFKRPLLPHIAILSDK
jgi:hypothetical protein